MDETKLPENVQKVNLKVSPTSADLANVELDEGFNFEKYSSFGIASNDEDVVLSVFRWSGSKWRDTQINITLNTANDWFHELDPNTELCFTARKLLLVKDSGDASVVHLDLKR